MKLIKEDISESIWRDKYRDGNEISILESKARVCRGVYANDKSANATGAAYNSMVDNLWCPGGRIHAGAGTNKRVTLINCYVNKTVPDSMVGIMDALNVAALTQQQGGGIGTDFSTVRPAGAVVTSSGSVSTGILPFMDMFHTMCSTVKSSGSRRGAMMGTLAIWHPDIIDFIKAKREKGRLTNFNVSVLVTGDFMEAVKNDAVWELGFNVPPKGAGAAVNIGAHRPHNPTDTPYWKSLTGQQEPSIWFIYRAIKARELWEMILRNTYDWAEPGVIFIDRINSENNLEYCEYIHCTNPCGEQPLPPNGDCNLGATNLAKMVVDPFMENRCEFNYQLLSSTTAIGMRFLDNVLDVSIFPTEEQKAEALAKRRTGIGIMGLANALQMLRIRYGTKNACDMTRAIMMTQRNSAYLASVELAKERGPFPLFDRDKYLERPYIKRLPEEIRDGIAKYGIRNGVIQTIAPTGTTSIYYDNVSSGIEPTFMWKHFRKVLQPDNSFAEFEVMDYGYKKYREYRFNNGDKSALENDLTKNMPDYMVTALELTVDEHLAMQAAAQEFVDSSISKTINCPKEIDFETFSTVYSKAYAMGLKGVTTYRPSDVRGAVLSVESQSDGGLPATDIGLIKGENGPEMMSKATGTIVPKLLALPEPYKLVARPDKLIGTTYKIKWPKINEAFYVTINDFKDDAGAQRPFEIFINSKSVQHSEWIAAITRCVSAIFRRGLEGGDITFIVDELIQVHSASGGAFMNGGYVPSIVALIGQTVETHLIGLGMIEKKVHADGLFPQGSSDGVVVPLEMLGDICPMCNQPTMFRQEGCSKCSCGYSSC